MNTGAKTHHSYWLANHSVWPRFETLRGKHRSDVAIIGGGITGLSTAIELQKRGYSVAIYEALVIGGGTTGGSTGHLDAHPEMGAAKMIESIGVEDSKAYVRWRQEAIDTIRRQTSEPCDFRNVDAIYYSEDSNDESNLRLEADAATRIGLNVSWADHLPISHAATGFHIRDLARIDPLAYLHHLANLVIQGGGKIYENCLAVPPEESGAGEMKAGSGTAEYSHLVIAVHSNFVHSMRIDLQLIPCQSYALVAKVEEVIPDLLMWDNAEPYYYTRRAISKDANSVLVGGCDHRTGSGDPVRASDDLKSYLSERYTVRAIDHQWSAELFEPVDRLPTVGRAPGEKNVYLATGLSGVGLTEGTGAAITIADLIEGKESRLSELFSPSRFSVNQLPAIAVEQREVMSNYAERILPTAKVLEADLQAGEGIVGKSDGQHAAVCRDESGKINRCSPICKHAGGVVRWNAAAQTWDCPVHGGRYMADGSRLYGPPIESLDKLDDQAAD